MTKSFFERNSKLVLLGINLIFIGIIALILTANIFQDAPGSERYSLIDKVSYQIRCDGTRHVKLRENKPNFERFVASPYAPGEKYALRTDENGFIKPNKIHENPDIVISFAGGSTTECETVHELKRFPYLAGRILEEKTGKKINSYNTARSGNSLIHAINNYVNKTAALKPDIEIYMDNINNLSTLLYEASYWNRNKTRSNLGCFSKKTAALRSGKNEWSESPFIAMFADKTHQQKIKNEQRKVLKMFVAIVRASGAMPVLMTQPNRIENNPNFSTDRGDSEFNRVYRQLYIEFNDITRQVAREENVLLIDLARAAKWDEKLIYDSVHLTGEGSELVAHVVAKELMTAVRSKHHGVSENR